MRIKRTAFRRRDLVVSAAYILGLTDWIAFVDATAAPVPVTLPAIASVRELSFIVRKDDVTANVVTISPVGGDTIDGLASLVLVNQGETVELTAPARGTNWRITSRGSLTASGGAVGRGLILWAYDAILPANQTRYMRPGTAGVGVSEIQIRTPNMIVKRLTILAQSGPGGARTDTWTLRKNGIDTALMLSLSMAAVSASSALDVIFVDGDKLSVKVNSGIGGLGTSDFVVIVEYV